MEYEEPKEGETKHICKNCNGEAEFETAAQLRGHQMKCRPKDKGSTREERVPFGDPVKRFNIPDDEKYHYRVFNDNWKKEPGRVKRAQNAGYEVVDDKITGTSVGTNEDGSEIKAVLMRIPKEWYDEDQAKKAAKLDEVDKQIYGEPRKQNRYGDVQME